MSWLGNICGAAARWLAFMLIGLAAGGWSIAAGAETLRLNDPLCHAVTALRRSDDGLSSLRFACTGTPRGYQRGSLWLQTRFDPSPRNGDGLVLMVHQSRFDRLAVAFSYADGVIVWQRVSGGAFGGHWRAGGQIAFEAPQRDAPLVGLTMRFDRLASHELLHLRLVGHGEGVVQTTGLAAAIGAALTLLLIGSVYNLSLARAVRRQYLAWQGGWAICMLLWGALWSQMHLLILPRMAGSMSAQICTFLACLAVALATTGAVTALDRRIVPRFLRLTTLVLGALVAIFGVPLALIRTGVLDRLGELMSLLMLADLACVTACLGYAMWKGSREARDFLGSWSVPMAALTFVNLVDVESLFWGSGSKLLVLVAATWQTLWLSIAATRRLADLRVERDHARAAEARAHELARRDPLTGLRNRRGFIEAVTPLLERTRTEGAPVALLLIDVDRFKSVNDIHGHEAGDMVLCTIARRLERWEGPMGTAARLGGEEFAIVMIGLEGFALARFADSVRREIAACDHRAVIGDRLVTASIGVAEAEAMSDFQQLYRMADQALYEAKRSGRDRVSLRTRDGLVMEMPDAERLQANS